MTGLSDGRKSVLIRLALLKLYRRVTDTQPASQTRCRSKDTAYYIARVKMEIRVGSKRFEDEYRKNEGNVQL